MRLICISRYRSSFGSFTAGQEVDVTDDIGELLMRDSPGSFELNVPVAPNPEPVPEVAISITASGLETPDRRARGGQRRNTRRSTDLDD